MIGLRIQAVSILCFAVVLPPTPSGAQQNMVPEDESAITLHKAFLGAQKFTYLGAERKGVWTFTGFSFTPEFESVIREDTAAYHRARESFLWNGVSLVGMTGLTVMAAKTLIDAINQSKALSEGRFTSGSGTADIPLMLASGAVAITGGLIARGKLRSAVRIFNANHRERTAGTTSNSGLMGTFTMPRPSIDIRRGTNLWPLHTGGAEVAWELRFGLRTRWPAG